MSHLILTRLVSQLLGLALVSWAFARIGVHRSPFPSPSILGIFHSLLSAIGFQSCFFSLRPTYRQLPPIRSTLHLLKYLTHPTSSLKPLPLAISPQLFHSKLKTLLFSKSYPDLSSSSYLPPRLNSKHHSP